MKENNDRQAIVAGIIRSRTIHTQDELIAALAEKGIEVTQATLSRDLKAIRAVKVNDEKAGSIYRLASQLPSKRRGDNAGFIRTVEISARICVVHCRPGFASAVASLIDHSKLDGIIGTLAGDDTVFVALAPEADTAVITENIKSLI